MSDEIETVEEAVEETPLKEGWVFMVHPSLENSKTKATAEAFEEVWAPRGWVLASADGAGAATTPEATSQRKATNSDSKQKGA